MRKKKTKVYWKKQKFGSFFLKVFVPFILVASLLSGIVTYLLVSIYESSLDDSLINFKQMVDNGTTSALNNYNEALKSANVSAADYDFQIADNRLMGSLDYYLNMATMYVVDDKEGRNGAIEVYKLDEYGNPSKVWENGAKYYLSVKDRKGEKYILSCSREDGQEMYKEARETKDASVLSIDELYVKGNSFWVGAYTYCTDEVEIIQNADGTADSEFKQYKVTNTNIPEGYVKIKNLSAYEISSTPIGSPFSTEKLDIYCDPEGLIGDAIAYGKDFVDRHDVSKDYQAYQYAEKDYKCEYGKHHVEVAWLGGGYDMVLNYHTNIWRSLIGKLMIGTWIGTILLSVIVSLVIAYAMYKTYKSAYDMERYRRTTSNAMAHDLKSPLAVILLDAENLRDGTNLEKNKYYMDNIIDEVNQMNTQIASILDMANAEDVSTQLDKTDVDITAIVNLLAEEYAERIKEKDVTIDIKGTCTVHADEKLMTQALRNVMDNAVKYVTDGGEIKVWLSDSSVSFVNASEPIDKETLANVWNPFVKGDNSRHGHKGTGLGLSIVKTIIDRHGFDCLMDNSADGVEVRLIFK